MSMNKNAITRVTNDAESEFSRAAIIATQLLQTRFECSHLVCSTSHPRFVSVNLLIHWAKIDQNRNLASRSRLLSQKWWEPVPLTNPWNPPQHQHFWTTTPLTSTNTPCAPEKAIWKNDEDYLQVRAQNVSAMSTKLVEVSTILLKICWNIKLT